MNCKNCPARIKCGVWDLKLWMQLYTVTHPIHSIEVLNWKLVGRPVGTIRGVPYDKPITWVGVTHCAWGEKHTWCLCACVCVYVWPKKVCHEVFLDGKSDEFQTWWVDAYYWDGVPPDLWRHRSRGQWSKNESPSFAVICMSERGNDFEIPHMSNKWDKQNFKLF